MSSTKYQILCRYYNSAAGRVVTNDTKIVWKQAENGTHGHNNGKQVAPTTGTKSVVGNENMIIRHEDFLRITSSDDSPSSGKPASKQYYSLLKNAKSIDSTLSKVIVDENISSNPKYDMIFLYDGISTCEGAEAVNTTKYIYAPPKTSYTQEDAPIQTNSPIVYYEKMKRFEGSPWFLYATASSLTAIMKKAEELVNIMGKDNVIIGKVVDIGEYIDIV